MKCSHIKTDGTQCKANTVFNSDYCWYHNPDIPDEVRLSACSKGGKANTVNNFIESPLTEIKIEKMQDLALMLSDTINNMRKGKISQKSGSSFGYLSFILFLVLEKALKEKERERIEKLKSEGKWRPEPKFAPKFYTYKDDYYLDKDGNKLVVEKDGSDFFHTKDFQLEEVEHRNKKAGKKVRKKRQIKTKIPDVSESIQKLNDKSRGYIANECDDNQKTMNIINVLKTEFNEQLSLPPLLKGGTEGG